MPMLTSIDTYIDSSIKLVDLFSVPGATKLIQKMDAQYKKDCHRKGNNLQQKQRVLGSPSKVSRQESPEWAVKSVEDVPESTTSSSSSDTDS